MAISMEKLLSTVELAERWGCSRAQVRTFIDRGELPHVKIGKLLRFRPDDIDAFERARRRSGEPEAGADSDGSAPPATTASLATAAE